MDNKVDKLIEAALDSAERPRAFTVVTNSGSVSVAITDLGDELSLDVVGQLGGKLANCTLSFSRATKAIIYDSEPAGVSQEELAELAHAIEKAPEFLEWANEYYSVGESAPGTPMSVTYPSKRAPNYIVIKRKLSTDEYVVAWYTNGKFDDAKSYYTGDKHDASDTFKHMQADVDKANNVSYKP